MIKFESEDIFKFCSKYIIGIYILIGLIAFAIFLLSLPHRLNFVNEEFIDSENGVSYSTFYASSGDKIKLTSYFIIDSGEVNIYLYDPDKKCVDSFEVVAGKKNNNILTIEKNGEYRVQLEYSNYIGSAEIGIFRIR